MAVIQIGKIRVRRGQKNVTGDFSLDSGEFGWALDTQELFIGNGTLEEGAPEIGKTRLLTEKDINLFNQGTYLTNSKLTLSASASTGTTTLYLSTLTSVDLVSNGEWRVLSGPGIQTGSTLTNISLVYSSTFKGWPITISTATISAISTGTTLGLSYYANNSYSYLDNDNGQHRGTVTVNTDPSGSGYNYRNSSDKLNDFVTIYDFAGIGDGITDNGEALQNAIDQLWLNTDRNQPRSRVALRIPAGLYLIYDRTIYLPPYATLIGDGPGRTVIRLTKANIDGPGKYGLFQTVGCSPVGDRVILGDFDSGSELPNIRLFGITAEWDSAYANGGGLPVKYEVLHPLLRIDSAIDSQIIDCEFKGYYPINNQPNPQGTTDYSAIEIRGQGNYTTRNLIIQNCIVDGFYYGIFSDYDIEDTIISNSTFRNSIKGIVGAQSLAPGNQIGPVRSRISNNKFYDIDQEAIYFYANGTIDPTYNISMNNSFVNVGQRMNANPSSEDTAVVAFESQGCKSIGDYFDRFNVLNSIPSGFFFQDLVQGIAYFEETSAIEKQIEAGTATLARFPIAAATQALKIQYSLTKTGISRKGDLLINVDRNASTVAITENYSYTGANNGSIEFAATINTGTNVLTVNYINSGLASGSITYKYSQLQ